MTVFFYSFATGKFDILENAKNVNQITKPIAVNGVLIVRRTYSCEVELFQPITFSIYENNVEL